MVGYIEYCQGCGGELSSNARFCQRCGRPVSSPYSGQQFAGFGSYPSAPSENENDSTRAFVAAIFGIIGVAGLVGGFAFLLMPDWGMPGARGMFAVYGIGALLVGIVFLAIGIAIYTKNDKMLDRF